MDDSYIIYPANPVPGMLAIFLPESMVNTLGEIERARKYETYKVAGIVADHIPLEFEMREFLSRPSNSLVTLSESPLTLNLHYGGSNVFFYDLIADGEKALHHIEVEIEADHPNAALQPARTQINQLLDTLMREIWLPLNIIRLDVFISGSEKPLLQQAVFPFNRILQFNLLGGFQTHYVFSTYESLLREAINATSPYYRLLCSYRLMEGIKFLRHKLRQICEKLASEPPPLPKPPKVEQDIFDNFWFRFEPGTEIKTVDQLISSTKPLRDAVGHFLSKEFGETALHMSSGENFRLYSAVGAILLHYAHMSFRDLLVYFNQHLSSEVFRGSILPLPELRKTFTQKAPTYYK